VCCGNGGAEEALATNGNDQRGAAGPGPAGALPPPAVTLDGTSPPSAVDVTAARRAVADLLVALGADPSAENLRETPGRVARAYVELLTPEPFDLTSFPNDEGYDELIVARGIPVWSLCEHHLLPFTGTAHVGYLPDERIIGLSKLARVVDLFARGLQVQERLTCQVADWLDDHVRPVGSRRDRGGGALLHDAAGVRASGSTTVTSALRGPCGTTRAPARSSSPWPASDGGPEPEEVDDGSPVLHQARPQPEGAHVQGAAGVRGQALPPAPHRLSRGRLRPGHDLRRDLGGGRSRLPRRPRLLRIGHPPARRRRGRVRAHRPHRVLGLVGGRPSPTPRPGARRTGTWR
jgi:GTP cyclohydrolase I